MRSCEPSRRFGTCPTGAWSSAGVAPPRHAPRSHPIRRPAATTTSTARPSAVPRVSRNALRILSWILAAAVVILVGRNLAHGLADLRNHPLPRSPNWGLVLLSGVVFLSGHA